MPGLHFEITADNSQLLRALRQTEQRMAAVSSSAEAEGGRIDAVFRRLTRSAAALAGGIGAKEIVQQVATVRGEFQKLEVAFRTMLGSKEQADALMAQLVQTAATTPFDLKGVADGARQLLAYGENVENVNDDLIRLGNIAAGLSQPLGDLVYLYGTTMTQGRLYTADLNQFTGRGIPMIRELAKVLGVAESEVRSLVEAGKVGFPEVQQVIRSLTDEGGMFAGLMQAQSKTISGQLSNLADSFQTMLNEVGRENEGLISGAIGAASKLVENYEEVGRTLMGLAASYGAYRAVLMAVASSLSDRPLPAGTVIFGEVGLTGEIRPIPRGQDRLKEAAKLGFSMAIIPKANAPKTPIEGLDVKAVDRLTDALAVILN